MKPQKGSKIYLQMALRMELGLGTGPRTEISGGDVLFELPHLQNLWFYQGFTTTFET